MKIEFPIKVKVELDGIDEILQELQELQTYKLFETDEMLLVSRADVAEILARHVRAKTAELDTSRERLWIFLYKHKNGEKRYSCPVCNSLSDAPYKHCPFCGTPMAGVRA